MRSAKRESSLLVEEEKMSLTKSNVFSHETRKARKLSTTAKSQSFWYYKSEKNEEVIRREVLGQEFFRLLIGYQPKTRMATSESKETFVLSKEVAGFQPLSTIPDKIINANLKSGNFTGLGDVLIASILLTETDLKFTGNLGLDKNNRIVKLDGGWCFSHISETSLAKENFEITEQLISRLPLLDGGYYSYHWLDVCQAGIMNPNPVAATADLAFNQNFRDEINAAILRAIVLPEEFIEAFVANYGLDKEIHSDRFTKEITDRIAELRKAGLANKSFCEYMQTPKAYEQLEVYIKYVKEFKTTQKNYPSSKVPMLAAEMQALFEVIRNSASSSDSSQKTLPDLEAGSFLHLNEKNQTDLLNQLIATFVSNTKQIASLISQDFYEDPKPIVNLDEDKQPPQDKIDKDFLSFLPPVPTEDIDKPKLPQVEGTPQNVFASLMITVDNPIQPIDGSNIPFFNSRKRNFQKAMQENPVGKNKI